MEYLDSRTTVCQVAMLTTTLLLSLNVQLNTIAMLRWCNGTTIRTSHFRDSILRYILCCRWRECSTTPAANIDFVQLVRQGAASPAHRGSAQASRGRCGRLSRTMAVVPKFHRSRLEMRMCDVT